MFTGLDLFLSYLFWSERRSDVVVSFWVTLTTFKCHWRKRSSSGRWCTVEEKDPITWKKHAPQNSQTFGCCSAVDRRRSVFGNNKSWSLLLACFTFTGNSCQQECSLSPHLSLWDSASLLVSWVLHTTTSCKQAGLPSPLPSSTSDLWRSPSDLLMHQNNYF